MKPRRPRRSRKQAEPARTPWADSPRTPLEKLAALAGGTAFKVPVEGRSTAGGLSVADVALALGTANDRLGEAMALAMACDRPQQWRTIEHYGVQELGQHLRQSPVLKRMVTGVRAYRIRHVLNAAFLDLIGQPPKAWRDAAHQLKMRRIDYMLLHTAASGWLDTRARAAAAAAVRYLTGPEDATGEDLDAPRAPTSRARRPAPAAAPHQPAPLRRRPDVGSLYGLLTLRRSK
jgi:hypothetical protein